VCVAITTTFYVLNLPVVEIVKFIRSHDAQVKIIAGGPLIANHFRSYQGKELAYVLSSIGADIYVHESQGEHTLAQLIDCLKAGADLARVPNIAYQDQGQLQQTARAPESNDMDAAAIDWLAFPPAVLGPTVQTRTARSCAFSCTFCAYPLRAGKLTLTGLETVDKEFSALQALGIKNVVFIDDTFNVPLDRFKAICRLIIEKGYQFNWFSYFRCSNSDEEAIELMAKSGCAGVFLGIESGSPSVLKNMHKAARVEQYLKGVGLLRQHHILTFGSFITGFPGETEQTVRETIDFIQTAGPDYYRTQLWYCEPGTPIYNQRAEYGIVGEGFRWEHKTMDSATAMRHIHTTFLAVDQSVWMPQWSFDFWFIPYVLGKGLSLPQFKDFMKAAHRLLQLEFIPLARHEKTRRQHLGLEALAHLARDWALV
jgi:p-methyltransferase